MKTTTIRVAEVSGYGLGLIYDFFPNEESFVATLIERHAQKMVAVVEPAGVLLLRTSPGPVVLTTV